MTLHLDDLPAGVREKVRASAGVAPPRPKASRTVPSAGASLTCSLCGEVFANPSEGRLTKHTEAHGRGVRYSMEVGP